MEEKMVEVEGLGPSTTQDKKKTKEVIQNSKPIANEKLKIKILNKVRFLYGQDILEFEKGSIQTIDKALAKMLVARGEAVVYA